MVGMAYLISKYKESLGLEKAKFLRIDHDDTMMAHVYRVIPPTGESLILKVCTREVDFYRELYFLKYLTEKLPVPRILQVVESGPGMEGAILMECLAGRLLQSRDWTDSLAYEVGATLARLHLNRTEGYGDLTEPQNLTNDPCVYFGQKFEEELAECRDHLPKELIEQCHHYFESHQSLLASVDGPCMIHRDFRPGNIIVYKGKLQGIIDWAGGRSGFAEQDFCPMVHRKWPTQPEHKKSLMAGYASIRPVPDYQAIMPLLQLGRALAVIGFTVKSETWNNEHSGIYHYNRQYLETFNFSL